jgi:hypothetical protein
MLSVYNYMAVSLGLTGLVAVIAVADGLYQQIAGTPLIWLVMLAPLAAVLFLSFRIERMNFATAHAIFWVYAGLMGLSLADIPAGLYRHQRYPGLLHHCRNLRGHEPVRIFHRPEPVAFRIILVHGLGRHHPGERG